VFDLDGPEPTGARARRRGQHAWTPQERAVAAVGDQWTLTIVLALAPGRMRLVQLQRLLPAVSTGVLERSIRRMDALGLLTRTRYRERPPRVELELTDAGRQLLPTTAALARWGMRHRWSAPDEHELVDLGALLRALPILLEERADLPDGSIELAVTGFASLPPFAYRVERGRLRLLDPDPTCEHEAGRDPDAAYGHDPTCEHEAGRDPDAAYGHDPARGPNAACDPDAAYGHDAGREHDAGRTRARVEGDQRAWIAALGPTRETARLRITGDGQLAEAIFAALPR
jgi:DNA-binding HxlR family transcriptional regulator